MSIIQANYSGQLFRGKFSRGSIINTDRWKAYDGLILNGYTHHLVFNSTMNLLEEKIMLWHRVFLELLQKKISKI